MYRVIVPFFDLQDKGYAYRLGDVYPRQEKEVGDGRIDALLSGKNRRGIPLIEEIKESEAVQDERASNLDDAESKSRKNKQRKR